MDGDFAGGDRASCRSTIIIDYEHPTTADCNTSGITIRQMIGSVQLPPLDHSSKIFRMAFVANSSFHQLMRSHIPTGFMTSRTYCCSCCPRTVRRDCVLERGREKRRARKEAAPKLRVAVMAIIIPAEIKLNDLRTDANALVGFGERVEGKRRREVRSGKNPINARRA